LGYKNHFLTDVIYDLTIAEVTTTAIVMELSVTADFLVQMNGRL
jgi:hypothetical protein